MIFSLFKKSPRADLPALKLHNTLSDQLEVFVPINGTVKMYNCGPTVYDRQHIGNLRPYVFADVLRRTIEAWGWPVKQVINITDVGHLTSDADEGEDKLEAAAARKGQSAKDIATEVTEWWFDDLDALGIDRSRITIPKATDYIEEQIALVKALEEKGYAYRTSDGVYFDTAKFADYGKLGHIDLMGQQAGARVEENKEKKNPHDFALWKLSPVGGKRQQEWESPWGVGFPGWHIECTAFIFTLLGKQIDIHTGGVDHIPVHHNNEIAQAEALTHKQYARYWLHNEFITIEGKKVSKSLGNTIYLSQLVDRGLFARSLRYWYLTGHYRSPMNFTWEALEGANQALLRLSRLYNELPKSSMPADPTFIKNFYTALADDLNTPQALAYVWDMVRDEKMPPVVKRANLIEAEKILGLDFGGRGRTFKVTLNATVAASASLQAEAIPAEVIKLVQEREEARKAKDFARADELRQQIEAMGFELKDTAEGPQLTKK